MVITEYIKYDWIYRLNSEKPKFEIIPNFKIETPNSLFKLFALNKYSFDALLNNYIYASHPNQFNDLFDCYHNLIKVNNDNLVAKIIEPIQPIEKTLELLKKDRKNVSESFHLNFKEMIFRKYGIYSMTSNPNNILLWSYYTNNAGFAVEFDYTVFPFNYHGPFYINYQKEISSIDIEEVGLDTAVLYMTNIKQEEWKHENEWRIIIEPPEGQEMFSPKYDYLKQMGGHNRKFHYPIEAIKSIALANRFFDAEELEIVNDDILKINLKENIEQKSLILDFLSTHNILTYIMLRNDDNFSFGYRPGKLERMDYKTYLINAC